MKKIFLIVACCISFAASAQENWDKLFNEFQKFQYKQVIETYQKKVKNIKAEKVLPTDVYQAVAESYLKTGNFRQASIIYGKLYQIQKTVMSDLQFNNYQQTLRMAGFYDDANRIIEEHLTALNRFDDLKHFKKQKKAIDSIAKTKPQYEINTVNSNSKNSDFGVMFYNDKVLFASANDTLSKSKIAKLNNQPYLTIYEAEMNRSNGNFSNIKKFYPKIQNKYHNATPTFSPDYKTMYFSTNQLNKGKLVLDKNKVNNLEILRVAFVDGKPSEPTDMFFTDAKASFGHPAMSPDGKYLYFVSDKEGGYGQTDLYRVKVFGDASYGKVENLGDLVNTAGREMFPFVQNNTLYFASDGHYGYGGLDVFASKIYYDGSLSEPINLGKPINSNADDFSFIVHQTDAYGYFSSNRAGGIGDDDIYFFTKAKINQCTHQVSGIVYYQKNNTPLHHAKVVLMNDKGQKIAEVLTDADGKYNVPIPCNSKVFGVATKEGYSDDKKNFITQTEAITNSDYKLYKIDDYLVTDGDIRKIDINTIYFDYNKWHILPKARLELDKVVFVMNQFPKVKIRIESHTDSRGNDAYNLKLSDNRAKATRDYIISKGISPDRILSAIGYGESQVKNNCVNGVKCTEADHAINRRFDFIVEEL